MTYDEIVAMLSEGREAEIDWALAETAGGNFDGFDFSGLDLRGADFSGASLRGALFVDANVDGVSFVGADISGADFTGASVEGADFTGAIYDDGTVFADVSGVPIGIILEEADGGGESVAASEAETDASDDGGEYAGADFTGANFTGANFTGANFTGAVLEGVVVDETQVQQLSFTEAAVEWLINELGSTTTTE